MSAVVGGWTQPGWVVAVVARPPPGPQGARTANRDIERRQSLPITKRPDFHREHLASQSTPTTHCPTPASKPQVPPRPRCRPRCPAPPLGRRRPRHPPHRCLHPQPPPRLRPCPLRLGRQCRGPEQPGGHDWLLRPPLARGRHGYGHPAAPWGRRRTRRSHPWGELLPRGHLMGARAAEATAGWAWTPFSNTLLESTRPVRPPRADVPRSWQTVVHICLGPCASEGEGEAAGGRGGE